jgi:hypothetical protein
VSERRTPIGVLEEHVTQAARATKKIARRKRNDRVSKLETQVAELSALIRLMSGKERYLTVDEITAEFIVHERTVYDLARNTQHLGSRKVAKLWEIPERVLPRSWRRRKQQTGKNLPESPSTQITSASASSQHGSSAQNKTTDRLR